MNYIGQWQNDHEHGQGTEVRQSFGTYTGQFNMGRKEGLGTLEFDEGEYRGSWYNNRMHGEGAQIWRDGRKHFGTFENN